MFQLPAKVILLFLKLKLTLFYITWLEILLVSLLKIGSGLEPATWMQEVLQAKNRRAAAETAPPDGLIFDQGDLSRAVHFSSIWGSFSDIINTF